MRLLLSLFILLCLNSLEAQINARLLRFPDVSENQIVFTYANDIWLVSKDGGTATRVSSPNGEESFAKFSPNGNEIAFTANYDGNNDIYVMPVTGGIPKRLTSHGYTDRMTDWTPDGQRILFASSRESGKMRFNQFYTVSKKGGPAMKLPLAYAEYGGFSPDGKRLAFTYVTQVFRTWKRYKGGTKGKIIIYDTRDSSSHQITPDASGGDEFPMWHGDKVYFISDRGKEERMNLYEYNFTTGDAKQLTFYTEFDIHYPSVGPDEIVYENGGQLHLYNLNDGTDRIIPVNVVTDESYQKPHLENTKNYIQNYALSPSGQRVLIEARGDIYSVPAEKGVVKNLTRTSGIAERSPDYSPDGKYISYWSDKSGEYELYLKLTNKEDSEMKITNLGPGFRYSQYWSPDSKKIVFIDQEGVIQLLDIDSKKVTKIDQLLNVTHGPAASFKVDWSSDSKWITYARSLSNNQNALYLYEVNANKLHQITAGFYNCDNPVFDESGKYLCFTTNQAMNPEYSDFDNTFIYDKSTEVGIITLTKDGKSLLLPENDTVTVQVAKTSTDDSKSDKKKKKDKKDKEEDSTTSEKKDIRIDLAGIESRTEILPIKSGNIYGLSAIKGKLLYLRNDDSGTNLVYFDLDKKEEKVILNKTSSYWLSADKKKIMVSQGGNIAIIEPKENQKFEDPIDKNNLYAYITPKEEWKQIFNDAWRLERDYFYDKNMHGVDWNLVRKDYGDMINDAATRKDVSFIIGEMIGELSSSHTYYSGGDVENTNHLNIGYLGVNWVPDGQYYKIGHIVTGAKWDSEVRSPLDQPGIDIREGDIVRAVNGISIRTTSDPFEAFAGLADKTVELTYTSSRFAGEKTAIVKLLSDEYRLRNLEWIESNRSRVDLATNGQVGYIYVPSTGIDGQNELMRMFKAQLDKKALIIDERFNNGGQIPDRFIEMLDRPPLVYWATRAGEPWRWPPAGHFGPKVMLANGWSGSGGDAFPDYFKLKKLGPLVGTRTWGGLIGISGAPDLIDGASVTVPTFRMYYLNGTWFEEGHGVEPDYNIPENPSEVAKGNDAQLQKAIELSLDLLKTHPFIPPQRPPAEKR